MNTLIIEDASLELVPPKFLNSPEALEVKDRFGVAPSMQILDRSLHRKIVSDLRVDHKEKRGRPDVVHYALLEATSTPLFQEGSLRVVMRTVNGVTIEVLKETRPPRTLERFCGVMSKLISGRSGMAETQLFKLHGTKRFRELVEELRVAKLVAFSAGGTPVRLHNLVRETTGSGHQSNVAWVVGGFPAGNYDPEVIDRSDVVVSIARQPLTAHVVVARLCYELEDYLIKF